MKQNFVKSVFILLLSTILNCGSGSQSALPQRVTFDLSGAEALVVLADVSNNTSTLTKNLTREEAESNLQKMLADGTLDNVVYFDTTDAGTIQVEGSVRVGEMTPSPVGDVVVVFDYPGIIFKEDYCWVVILNDAGEAYCIYAHNSLEEHNQSRGIDFEDNPITFDQSGNVYFYDDGLYKWSRSDQTLSLVFDFNTINLFVSCFLPNPDGSFIISGELEGDEESNFFIFTSTSSGQGSLEESCLYVEPLACGDGWGELESNFTFAPDNSLYVLGSGSRCEDLADSSDTSGLIRVVFADEEISYSLMGSTVASSIEEEDSIEIEGGYNFFVRDSEGNLYIKNSDISLIEVASLEEITFSTVVDSELSEANGDYLFLTGTDSEGNRVFMRKALLGDREEIDLLGGSNLLVQHFDVASNGDVYFGALDLDTTTVYLYKYNNTTGQLEQLDSLSSNLEEILVL